MKNPWETILLRDYENHMKLDSVRQLQAINEMMRSQLYTYDVSTVLILGVAGGNGLNHVEKPRFKKVYGLDVNRRYLDECVKRFPDLHETFVPLEIDLLDDISTLPESDLVIANLLIEYIGYECFQRVISQTGPRYASCVIQDNSEKHYISDSPYNATFTCLDNVHHRIREGDLGLSMREIGYQTKLRDEKAMPNNKKLVRLDFSKG